jgi:hypothetical protein
MKDLVKTRVLVAVVLAVLVIGTATAGAANLITGADVKNGSLTGKDIKDGSLLSGDIKNGTLTGKDVKDGSLASADVKNGTLTGGDVKDGSLASADIKNGSLTGGDVKDGSLGAADLAINIQDLLNAVPVRVTDALPTMGFSASNGSVTNTSDGVTFGPYADGGAAGGSLCTSAMNGQPLNTVNHLAYEARYTADGDTGGVGVPYLRIFLEADAHDAIFSPNTQPPDPDVAEGPFHTWVGTAGLWRYDDDGDQGTGEFGHGAPLSAVKATHGTETISKICISTGFSAGTNLSALLRSWEVNSTHYAFGL